MEIRKYESIPNIYKVSDKFLKVGDLIHVSEKIDGANASFRKDESGKMHYYSRNSKLEDDYGLRGFVEWCNENLDKDWIKPNYIFYGEWVVRHKIKYSEEIENTFVLFDVYDVEENEYVTTSTVKYIANRLGLKTPKKLYDGEYISLEHLQQFV
ncbi:MAG: RNA ligase family protein [Paraclostridium sp.]